MGSPEPWMWVPSAQAWPAASAPIPISKGSDWPQRRPERKMSAAGTTPLTSLPSLASPEGDMPRFNTLSFVSKDQVNAWSGASDGLKKFKKGKQNPPVPPPQIVEIEPPGSGDDADDKLLDEELLKQNLYKTELCRSFTETGACRYGHKCQFAHGGHELRPVMRHPKYKTEVCKKFQTSGQCPYGTRCRFIHPAPPVLSPPVLGPMTAAASKKQETVWTSSWQADDTESSEGDDSAATHRLSVFQHITPE